MSDALGDRMKAYEMLEVGRKLLPLIPAIARIDGRSFSRFTKGLERPYDIRLSDLMVETVKYLVEETHASCGYTQSDEISLVYYSDSVKSEIFFNGRIQKMESVLAGMASTYFTYRCSEFLPPTYVRKLPHFDARVWNVPTKEEAANCLLWREWDATKNSISMAAQHYYSHTALMHKNGSEKQEMLFQAGVNWNDYPAFFKRGSYIRQRKTLRAFDASELERLPPRHEARTNSDLMVERTDYVRVEMPPFGKVLNRVGVVFAGESPVTE